MSKLSLNSKNVYSVERTSQTLIITIFPDFDIFSKKYENNILFLNISFFEKNLFLLNIILSDDWKYDICPYLGAWIYIRCWNYLPNELEAEDVLLLNFVRLCKVCHAYS